MIYIQIIAKITRQLYEFSLSDAMRFLFKKRLLKSLASVSLRMAIPIMAAMSILSSATKSDELYTGELIFGGQGLWSLNLDTGTIRSEKKMESVVINRVCKISDSSIVASAYHLGPTSESRDYFLLYNLEDNVVEKAGDGKLLDCDPDNGAIYFIDVDGNTSYTSVLDLASKTILGKASPNFRYGIYIGEGRFLYNTASENANSISLYSYNVGTIEEASYLSKCDIESAIWLGESSNSLLCANPRVGSMNSRWSIVDIDNGVEREFTGCNESCWPVGYIEKYNSVVLQIRSFSIFRGERHRVVLVSVDGNRTYVASENLMLGKRIGFFETVPRGL